MHQTHFLLLAQNDFEVNGSRPDDTIHGNAWIWNQSGVILNSRLLIER